MAVMGVDLSELPEGVRKEMHEIFTRQFECEAVMARARQEKIKRFYEDNQPRWKDGYGPMVSAVDPWWQAYFNMKYGEEAMDRDFLKWVVKEEPMFAVKAVAPKTKVSNCGLALEGCGLGLERERAVKFRKKF